jgi:hypothetical protein
MQKMAAKMPKDKLLRTFWQSEKTQLTGFRIR